MSFNSSGKRQYRRRKESSDAEKHEEETAHSSDEEQRLKTVLEDVRDLQKLRAKPAGLSTVELALGKEAPRRQVKINADPLKLKSGGMLDLKRIKNSDLKNADIEDDIRQQFSKESHLRDEDEEMRKFVEDELSRRRGHQMEERPEGSSTPPVHSDDQLFAQVAGRLKKYQSKKNEEMLSQQMLCGIPEVDLGIDAKMRNIEETEVAKHRLLQEAIAKKKDLEKATTFKQDLVKDLAKDYVQHGRYNISETTDLGTELKRPRIERPTTESIPVVGEDTPQWILDGDSGPPANAKPSDKQMYERFKKKYKEKDGNKR